MDFRKKLLILAASGMAFAGLAYGDACGAAQINPTPAPPNLLRLEGTAELVTDVNVACTGNTLAATTGQLIVSLGLPVTSKQTAAGPPPTYEATLIITPTAAGSVSAVYFGTPSGSQVTFGTATTPVTFPAAAYALRVANIRVNASTGANATYVGESLLATNQGVVIYATTPVNVGYIQQGFAAPSLVANSVNNYVICSANPAKGIPPATSATNSFSINVAENFGGAFKTQTGAGTCGGVACTVTNGEQGSYVPGGTSAVGTANSGTLFLFSFANIASGEVIYMPLTFSSVVPAGAPAGTLPSLTFTLITSLTNTTALKSTVPTGSTLPPSAALTSANGAATAVYQVTATDNTVLGESAAVTGYITANPGFATGAVSPVTVTVTPAGTGSVNPTLVIPNFTTSSNTALTLSSFGVCQTTLLFPFVTAAQNFDTGIALANTSTDPFGTPTTPGTCALNLYGSGAPTVNTGIASPGGSIASGTVATFQLGGSGIAPGFQGYMIVQCNFQYAHGYAFILSGSGTTAVAQGYLSLVITANPLRGPAPEALNN